MNWKYWVIRKMKPSSVKKATVTEAHAAAKRGLRNSDTSSIGSRVRRSRGMNAASRGIGSAKPTSVRPPPPRNNRRQRGEPQRKPHELPHAAPAVVGGLDDREDQQGHRNRREPEPGPVERGRVRVARRRHRRSDQRARRDRDGRHREEDARPGEALQEPPAHD